MTTNKIQLVEQFNHHKGSFMKRLVLLFSAFSVSRVFAAEPISYEYKFTEKGFSGQLVTVNVESVDIPVKPIFVSVLTVNNKNGHTCEFRGKENTVARISGTGKIEASFTTIDENGKPSGGSFDMTFAKNSAAITKANILGDCGLNGNPLGKWVKVRKL